MDDSELSSSNDAPHAAGTSFKRPYDHVQGDGTNASGSRSSNGTAHGSRSESSGNKRARSSSPLRTDRRDVGPSASASTAPLRPPSTHSRSRGRTTSPRPGSLLRIDPALLSLTPPAPSLLPLNDSSAEPQPIEIDLEASTTSFSTTPAQVLPSTAYPTFASPASPSTMSGEASPSRSAPPQSSPHVEALESVLARAREFQENVDAIRDGEGSTSGNETNQPSSSVPRQNRPTHGEARTSSNRRADASLDTQTRSILDTLPRSPSPLITLSPSEDDHVGVENYVWPGLHRRRPSPSSFLPVDRPYHAPLHAATRRDIPQELRSSRPATSVEEPQRSDIASRSARVVSFDLPEVSFRSMTSPNDPLGSRPSSSMSDNPERRRSGPLRPLSMSSTSHPRRTSESDPSLRSSHYMPRSSHLELSGLEHRDFHIRYTPYVHPGPVGYPSYPQYPVFGRSPSVPPPWPPRTTSERGTDSVENRNGIPISRQLDSPGNMNENTQRLSRPPMAGMTGRAELSGSSNDIPSTLELHEPTPPSRSRAFALLPDGRDIVDDRDEDNLHPMEILRHAEAQITSIMARLNDSLEELRRNRPAQSEAAIPDGTGEAVARRIRHLRRRVEENLAIRDNAVGFAAVHTNWDEDSRSFSSSSSQADVTYRTVPIVPNRSRPTPLPPPQSNGTTDTTHPYHIPSSVTLSGADSPIFPPARGPISSRPNTHESVTSVTRAPSQQESDSISSTWSSLWAPLRPPNTAGVASRRLPPFPPTRAPESSILAVSSRAEAASNSPSVSDESPDRDGTSGEDRGPSDQRGAGVNASVSSSIYPNRVPRFTSVRRRHTPNLQNGDTANSPLPRHRNSAPAIPPPTLSEDLARISRGYTQEGSNSYRIQTHVRQSADLPPRIPTPSRVVDENLSDWEWDFDSSDEFRPSSPSRVNSTGVLGLSGTGRDQVSAAQPWPSVANRGENASHHRQERSHRATDNRTRRSASARGSVARALRDLGTTYPEDFDIAPTAPSSPTGGTVGMDVDEPRPYGGLRSRGSLPSAPRPPARHLSGPGFDDVRSGYTPPVSRANTMESRNPPALLPLPFVERLQEQPTRRSRDESGLSSRASEVGFSDLMDIESQRLSNGRPNGMARANPSELRHPEHVPESSGPDNSRSQTYSANMRELRASLDLARQFAESLYEPPRPDLYRWSEPQRQNASAVRNERHTNQPPQLPQLDFSYGQQTHRNPTNQRSPPSLDNPETGSPRTGSSNSPEAYARVAGDFRREMERERTRLRQRRARDEAGEARSYASGLDRIMSYMGRQGQVASQQAPARPYPTLTPVSAQDRVEEPVQRWDRNVQNPPGLSWSSSSSEGASFGTSRERLLNRSPPFIPPPSAAFESALPHRFPPPHGLQRPISPTPAPRAARRQPRLLVDDRALENWSTPWREYVRTADRRAFYQSRRRFGDYVLESEWDQSYEGLLRLSARIGDVRPAHTPADVISSLPRGVFRDFPNPTGETRCPICLDDYSETDEVLAVHPCTHFFHMDCLRQWLQTSKSCPNCRATVVKSNARTGATEETDAEIDSSGRQERTLPNPITSERHATLELSSPSFVFSELPMLPTEPSDIEEPRSERENIERRM